MCALQELALGDLALHVLMLDEVVVDLVDLARPRIPGRVAHRKPEDLAEFGLELVDQRAFPDA
jgi:hypothetical protein